MSLTPDPNATLREAPATAPPPSASAAAPSSSGPTWFMPLTIAVMVVQLCGLAWLAHDLGQILQTMQAQTGEMKERLDTTTSRLEGSAEKGERPKDELE